MNLTVKHVAEPICAFAARSMSLLTANSVRELMHIAKEVAHFSSSGLVFCTGTQRERMFFKILNGFHTLVTFRVGLQAFNAFL
jgi:hypothetical protein